MRNQQRFWPITTRAVRAAACLVLLCAGWTFTKAQSSPAPKSHAWDYTALAKVPAKMQARRNPREGDHDAVPAGKKLYGQHCSQCHGTDAGGGRRGPDLRVPEVQQATPGAMFYVLSNGVIRRGMPGWSKLPEPERWQLVSFLKSVGKEAP